MKPYFCINYNGLRNFFEIVDIELKLIIDDLNAVIDLYSNVSLNDWSGSLRKTFHEKMFGKDDGTGLIDKIGFGELDVNVGSMYSQLERFFLTMGCLKGIIFVRNQLLDYAKKMIKADQAVGFSISNATNNNSINNDSINVFQSFAEFTGKINNPTINYSSIDSNTVITKSDTILSFFEKTLNILSRIKLQIGSIGKALNDLVSSISSNNHITELFSGLLDTFARLSNYYDEMESYFKITSDQVLENIYGTSKYYNQAIDRNQEIVNILSNLGITD